MVTVNLLCPHLSAAESRGIPFSLSNSIFFLVASTATPLLLSTKLSSQTPRSKNLPLRRSFRFSNVSSQLQQSLQLNDCLTYDLSCCTCSERWCEKGPLLSPISIMIDVFVKVPGNFHVSTHAARSQPQNPDMTHEILELRIGETDVVCEIETQVCI